MLPGSEKSGIESVWVGRAVPCPPVLVDIHYRQNGAHGVSRPISLVPGDARNRRFAPPRSRFCAKCWKYAAYERNCAQSDTNCGQSYRNCGRSEPDCGQSDANCERSEPDCAESHRDCGQSNPNCGQSGCSCAQSNRNCERHGFNCGRFNCNCGRLDGGCGRFIRPHLPGNCRRH